jgi:transcriptional regulator with XRE-family HTH domain
LARQTREALGLLGQLIRVTRIERGLKVQDLADRVGVSRDLIHRIEKGDPRCGIGVVFEAATVLALPLFAADPTRVADERARLDEKLRLLPKAVHRASGGADGDGGVDVVDDAF